VSNWEWTKLIGTSLAISLASTSFGIAIWWWLACCYDNFLFSCQICNQVYKGDLFPLSSGCSPTGEPAVKSDDPDTTLAGLVGMLGPDPVAVAAGRTFDAFCRDCDGENPLLINPYRENPETIICYEVDSALKEVRVVPRRAVHYDRVKACETCLGINREQLCQDRWKRYVVLDKVWRSWRAVPAKNKRVVAEIFRPLVADGEAFAGMARYFVREVWKVPNI